MNVGDIKREVMNLGFADEQEMSELEGVPYDAINRAIKIIGREIAPIIGTYEIDQDGKDTEYQYYDMRRLTKKDGKQTFLGFADTPVMIESASGDSYKKFGDYDIEQDAIMVLPGDVQGVFRVFYKKHHTVIDISTDDDMEIELPLHVHDLIPLKAAYYVWLEDEPQKADEYNVAYKQAVADIETETASKPRARIVGRGI